jgi:hypothetical protein
MIRATTIGGLEMSIMLPLSGRLNQDYHVDYPDPLVAYEGEVLKVTEQMCLWQDQSEWVWWWCQDARGKEGWVPQTYLSLIDQASTLNQDYSAHELEATNGEVVIVEAETSGWYWCHNQQGKAGWLPVSHVDLIR